VFLQIICHDSVELEVPGHSYTFGTVKETQARADLHVGRPAFHQRPFRKYAAFFSM
jgi:hypothetical protein